jgi:hypothetical protein
MRSAVFIAVWLLGSSLGIAAHAACDSGLAERMHAKLHPGRQLDHERAACQPWRAFPGRSIVVLPLPRPGSEPDFAEFDLDVLVVQQADNGNTERMTIVSRLFEEKALTHDAIRIEEIRVDTARYRLAQEARAFGVRVRYQGSSRANPYANETLSLYVPQGPRLAKVLDGLEMSLQRGEWDMQCAGTFESVRGSLSLGPGASNGYTDLTLHRTHIESVNRRQGEECAIEEEPARFSSAVIRYDGRAYRMPKKTASD